MATNKPIGDTLNGESTTSLPSCGSCGLCAPPRLGKRKLNQLPAECRARLGWRNDISSRPFAGVSTTVASDFLAFEIVR